MNILTTKEFELKVKGWKIYSQGGINMERISIEMEKMRTVRIFVS